MKQWPVLLGLLSLSWLSACGLLKTPTATPSPLPTTPVRVQLSWTPNIEFAGFEIAQSDGLYQQNGLAVEIVPGGFDSNGNFIDISKAVVTGEAQFGTERLDLLLQEYADGETVVAIAAIYQRSPLGIISLKQTGIQTPQDLVGKRVMITHDKAVEAYFKAFLARQKIDPNQVEIISRSDFSLDPLTAGEADALDSFITNEPIVLHSMDLDYNFFLFSDYGVDAYPNLIFTSQANIDQHPEMVKAFLDATLEGYQRAINHPEYAAQVSVQFNPTLLEALELASMKSSIPLLLPSADSTLGQIQPEAINVIYQLLYENGILSQPADPAKLYNLNFLKAIKSSHS